MPPAQALATNSCKSPTGAGYAISDLILSAAKVVNLADQKLNILMTSPAQPPERCWVQHVQSDILKQILPLLVIGIGLHISC